LKKRTVKSGSHIAMAMEECVIAARNSFVAGVSALVSADDGTVPEMAFSPVALAQL